MISRRTIRKIIWAWQNWKTDRQIYQKIRKLREQRAKASRQHKPTRKIDRELRGAVLASLRTDGA